MTAMTYEGAELKLLEDRLIDRLGEVRLGDLPDPQPECPARLVGATPMLERLWRVALRDIESNIQETEDGRYFGGGAKFGVTVYTRDISYSGVLGLNRLYPQVMRDSLEATRRVRRKAGFTVSRGHAVRAIEAPWEDLDVSEPEFKDRFHTNSYSRRTDDVVWLWAASDLFALHGAEGADWEWLYSTGAEFFQAFYSYFYDPEDSLYRGQASFIDVAWPERGRVGGYPQHFKIDDCLLLKAASTNALYLKGMRVMAEAATQLGKTEESREWSARADRLAKAIREHLVDADGRIVYYKDRHGELSERWEALGTALCALHGAVDAETARRSVERYPQTEIGIPVFHPFLEHDRVYHNKAAWPFVDTFFLAGAEKATGESKAAYNLALLARTARDEDGFYELVNMLTGEVRGSGRQLWSAAGFVNACVRAGIEITNA